jgi:hypothetical protein
VHGRQRRTTQADGSEQESRAWTHGATVHNVPEPMTSRSGPPMPDEAPADLFQPAVRHTTYFNDGSEPGQAAAARPWSTQIIGLPVAALGLVAATGRMPSSRTQATGPGSLIGAPRARRTTCCCPHPRSVASRRDDGWRPQDHHCGRRHHRTVCTHPAPSPQTAVWMQTVAFSGS